MTERATEVRDKTCWTIALILAIVHDEAKDGPVGIDRSEGHTPAIQGGGACSACAWIFAVCNK